MYVIFEIVLALALLKSLDAEGYWYWKWHMKINWCLLGSDTGFCKSDAEHRHQESLKHLMCKFPREGRNTDALCSDSQKQTNDSFRNRILHLHNDFRNKWANSEWEGQSQAGYQNAANMRFLVNHFKYDQNVAYTCTERMSQALNQDNIPKHFSGWVKGFETLSNSHTSNLQKIVGDENQFVALVSGETHSIGCAISIFKNRDHRKFPDKSLWCQMMTCNYGPSSEINKPLYITGEPGTKCPNGTRSNVFGKYKFLCAIPRMSEISKGKLESNVIAEMPDPVKIGNNLQGDEYDEHDNANTPPAILNCGFLIVFYQVWQ